MLTPYPVPGKAKAKMLCDAFAEGAPRNAVGSVFYGVKVGNHDEWQAAQRGGRDFYFIDNSYFDQTRGTHFRVTKNKIQWTGIGTSDCERFHRLGIEIAPWRPVGAREGYMLICPQSDDHMRYTVGYKGDWLKHTLHTYSPAGPVRVRDWDADKPKIMRSLAHDLAGANLLVTHTSAAAVMATLAGVPTICDPTCAAFGMYGADRLWWAGVLADNQFTLDEMKDGTAWRKLNP